MMRFAALWHAQPAARPWVPVTDYSEATRRRIEQPQVDRFAQVFPDHGVVLDYGCGTGLLVTMLREQGIQAYGYEPFRPPAPDLRRYTHVPFRSRGCDVVICREVLEHIALRHVPETVHDLCRLAKGYVYLTTRFHPAPDHLLDVATGDDLDPTHITLLNQDFLRCLFLLEGFVRDEAKELAMDHQQQGRVLVYRRP